MYVMLACLLACSLACWLAGLASLLCSLTSAILSKPYSVAMVCTKRSGIIIIGSTEHPVPRHYLAMSNALKL